MRLPGYSPRFAYRVFFLAAVLIPFGLPPLFAAVPLDGLGRATEWKRLLLDAPEAAWQGRDGEAAALILRSAELAGDRPYILHACAVMLLELDAPFRHLERALELVSKAEALHHDQDGFFQQTRELILSELHPLEKAARVDAASSRVAPIFEHYSGQCGKKLFEQGLAPEGYASLFLGEEEALSIIREELEARGLKFTEQEVPVPGVLIQGRGYGVVMDFLVKGEYSEHHPAEKSPFKADLMDPEKRCAVEFIAREDYVPLGGTGDMMVIAGPDDPRPEGKPLAEGHYFEYDFLQLAGKVREAATEQSEGLWVGIFYDPVAWEFPLEDLLSRKDKMFRRVKTWPGCDEDSQRFLEELIKKRRAESRKDRLGMSRRMLRRQVRDFAKWLKEQGAI